MTSTIFWWSITALALFGAWLNARRRWQGFVVWMFTNAAMGVKSASQGDWAEFVLWGVYGGICIVGLCTWKRKENEE